MSYPLPATPPIPPRAHRLARPARKTRRRRGLTFIELLIALSITAVTCGILAVLINATAVGTNTQNDGRRGLIKLQAMKSSLEDEFINTRAVLDCGSNYMVYWIGDVAGAPVPVNNAVNYSELRLLQLDTATGNLNLYAVKWPAGSTTTTIINTDVTCPSTSSWLALCNTLKGTNYYPATTLATNVTAFSISLDNATPSSAKFIGCRIDTDDGVVPRQLIMGVTMANPLAPY